MILTFVIDKNGYVTEATVVQGLDPACDKECLRIVNLMPQWIPGIQDGKRVSVKYNLPITFKITHGRSKKKKKD